jgi:hypothetical protein
MHSQYNDSLIVLVLVGSQLMCFFCTRLEFDFSFPKFFEIFDNWAND